VLQLVGLKGQVSYSGGKCDGPGFGILPRTLLRNGNLHTIAITACNTFQKQEMTRKRVPLSTKFIEGNRQRTEHVMSNSCQRFLILLRTNLFHRETSIARVSLAPVETVIPHF